MTARSRLLVSALALVAAPLALSPRVSGRQAVPASPLRSGEDLQRALDAAEPGDVIRLEPGAVLEGPFTLPAKKDSGWITITSSRADETLRPGRRVSPADAAAMAKLQSAAGPVIATAAGAHDYRIVGLEIRPGPGRFLTNLVALGSGDDDAEDVPRRFSIERCYIHGDPKSGSRRGVALNSAETSVVDSYLSDFKEVDADSQAIAGWNGPGPFRIENNLMEGAGENLLFGGADPAIRGLVPSDIVIRRNLLRKPLEWKRDERGFQGTHWLVKNILELKNARHVEVSGNVLENNWVDGQAGFAVLFTVRNQEGTAPWSVVEGVTFEDNVVRGTANGVNVLGHDDLAESRGTSGITIRNNLFLDVGDPRWGAGGRLFQLLDGTADVLIRHNTALHTGNIVTVDGRPHTGFVFEDNIVWQNQYGIIGTSQAPGRPTLVAFFPGAIVRGNAIVGGSSASYPPGNFFPKDLSDVGFSDVDRGDYRLRSGSPLKGAATDGADVGVLEDRLPNVAVLAATGLLGALGWGLRRTLPRSGRWLPPLADTQDTRRQRVRDDVLAGG